MLCSFSQNIAAFFLYLTTLIASFSTGFKRYAVSMCTCGVTPWVAQRTATKLQAGIIPGQAQVIEQGDTDWEQISGFFQLFAEGDQTEPDVDRRAQNLLINGFLWELLAARKRWAQFAGDFAEAYAACGGDEEKEALIVDSYRKLERGAD